MGILKGFQRNFQNFQEGFREVSRSLQEASKCFLKEFDGGDRDFKMQFPSGCTEVLGRLLDGL